MFKTRTSTHTRVPSFLAALVIVPFLSLSAHANAQEMTPLADMPAGAYKLDKTHASLIWKVSHAGLSNYAARFTRFDATVTLDPKDVTKSKLVATVDPTSIETDHVSDRDFNKELSTGKEWFNTNTYKEIRFESTRIEKTGDHTGKIHGNLTFLGVTKPLTMDATFNGAFKEQPFSKLPTLGFSATAELNRSDWGLKTYVPMIGDKVSLQIEVELAQQPAKTTTTTAKK